jgi:hypothetical protein
VGRLVSPLFPTERPQEQSVDVTVRAQGKTTFAELVERFAAGDSVRGVPGTASRVHGVAVQNPPRALSR